MTTMIEATDKNIRIINKYSVTVTIFGGYCYIKGAEKEVRKIARKVKALI